MNSNHLKVAKRCGAALTQFTVIAGWAAMLAGCNTTREMTGSVTMDYRQRHPIVIQEGARSVDLLIGSKRGSLTDSLRADVLAFAHDWRNEATGGILIDVPEGSSNASAAAATAKEQPPLSTQAADRPETV